MGWLFCVFFLDCAFFTCLLSFCSKSGPHVWQWRFTLQTEQGHRPGLRCRSWKKQSEELASGSRELFHKYLRCPEIRAGGEPALWAEGSWAHVPASTDSPYFAAHCFPSRRRPVSMLSFFDSFRIWPRVDRKWSRGLPECSGGGNSVMSEGCVVKNNWGI